MLFQETDLRTGTVFDELGEENTKARAERPDCQARRSGGFPFAVAGVDLDRTRKSCQARYGLELFSRPMVLQY